MDPREEKGATLNEERLKTRKKEVSRKSSGGKGRLGEEIPALGKRSTDKSQKQSKIEGGG